jgi:type IV pilus biogenesis protein PilP
MKIASNLACYAFLAAVLSVPTAAFAQALGEAATAMGAAVGGNANAITQGSAVTKKAEQAVVPVPAAIALDSDAEGGTMMTGGGSTPGIAGGEDVKTPDAVKNVMKRLNSSTSNITLEDLNAAREAVARVDMLIELEKKLKDLSEIRKDHKGSDPFENALPASALGVKFPLQPQPTVAPIQTANNFPSAIPTAYGASTGDVVVERIIGAGGRYTAMVKVNDGKVTQARVGDELSNGSTVKAISDQGVTVEKDKKIKTIKVRNVNNVFNSR